jgi:hypothetical protein
MCDSTGALTRSMRVVCSCIILCLCDVFSFLFFRVLERSLHAPFIVSRRCRVTRCWNVGRSLLEKQPRGLGGGPYLVKTCLAL